MTRMNEFDRYCYRKCKCVRCGCEDIIHWNSIVPCGLIIEPDEPCGVCGDDSAFIGDEVSLDITPHLSTRFCKDDVVLH
jgi:hypothetical protein